MIEVSNTNVTSVAEEAAHDLRFVAMIDMKRFGSASRLICAANGTFPFLLDKESIKISWFESVIFVAKKFSRSLFVVSSPFSCSKAIALLGLRSRPSPFVDTIHAASLAVNLKSMHCISRAMEIAHWLVFPTSGTRLAIGDIEFS